MKQRDFGKIHRGQAFDQPVPFRIRDKLFAVNRLLTIHVRPFVLRADEQESDATSDGQARRFAISKQSTELRCGLFFSE